MWLSYDVFHSNMAAVIEFIFALSAWHLLQTPAVRHTFFRALVVHEPPVLVGCIFAICLTLAVLGGWIGGVRPLGVLGVLLPSSSSCVGSLFCLS